MNPEFDEQWLHEVLELLRSEVEPRLLPLFRFCLEHPRDRLSVEDLARRFRVHRRALEYRLARANLLAPGRVMSWARMIHAAHVFERNAGSVEAIAEACGYSSSNAMRKSFERHGLRLGDVRRLGGFKRAVISLMTVLHPK
jgi:transcriptional regulator GlxA family with amidase domain